MFGLFLNYTACQYRKLQNYDFRKWQSCNYNLKKFEAQEYDISITFFTIFIPFFHTLRTQRTIKFRGAKTWNAVPDDLKRVNFYHFKLKFKQYLLNNH